MKQLNHSAVSFAVWVYADFFSSILLCFAMFHLVLDFPLLFLDLTLKLRASVICAPFVPFAFPFVSLFPVLRSSTAYRFLPLMCTLHAQGTQMRSTQDFHDPVESGIQLAKGDAWRRNPRAAKTPSSALNKCLRDSPRYMVKNSRGNCGRGVRTTDSQSGRIADCQPRLLLIFSMDEQLFQVEAEYYLRPPIRRASQRKDNRRLDLSTAAINDTTS
jgi:hypothetical protein